MTRQPFAIARSRFRGRAWMPGALGLACLAAVGLHFGRASAVESATVLPPPAIDEPAAGRHTQTAVFAGGCFWGVQGVFQHVKGVTNAVAGYAGGDAGTARYEAVGTGRTGHAESVEVRFDPSVVSYGKLMQVYFSVAHDPTQLDRQGPDLGPQYRSALFPQGEGQRKVARAYIAQLEAAKAFGKPIVTRLEDYKGFFPAENYHQNFLALNPGHPYIARNDLPKLAELERLFPAEYAQKPVLVPGVAVSK